MRVIYEATKGHRIKKGTTKIKIGDAIKRVDNFIELERISPIDLYWCDDTNSWINSEDYYGTSYWVSSSNNNIKNLRQAIKHIKKHDEIPKGAIFVLYSRFQGYNITIIK